LARQIITDNREALVRLAEALLIHETLDAVQIRRVVAGLPIDGDSPAQPIDENGTPEAEETSKNPFKKPILPPITGNNPATA
jgi:cell division protease FtsH